VPTLNDLQAYFATYYHCKILPGGETNTGFVQYIVDQPNLMFHPFYLFIYYFYQLLLSLLPGHSAG